MRTSSIWLAVPLLVTVSCGTSKKEQGALVASQMSWNEGQPFQITYEVRDGLAILDEDIVLGRLDEQGRIKNAHGWSASVWKSSKWPNAVIPYDASTVKHPQILPAIEHFHKNTVIRFVPRTNESSYLTFATGPQVSTCSAYVGNSGSFFGGNTVTLADVCDFNATVHELGHAAGLFHEHQRADRDQYIRINGSSKKIAGHYGTEAVNRTLIGPYDLQSIMHYQSYIANDDGKPLITKLDGSRIDIAQGRGLSSGDIAGLAALYADTDNKRPVGWKADGKSFAKYAVYRPSSGQWIVEGATKTPIAGTVDMIPVPGNWTGGPEAEIALFLFSESKWWVTGMEPLELGWAGVDLAAPGDYDGDGDLDFGVYRPTTSEWFVLNGRNIVSPWGGPNDVPVCKDYDGDGQADQALFRKETSEWLILQSAKGVRVEVFGDTTKKNCQPAAEDYDGDGKADLAVACPSLGGLHWKVKFNTGPVEFDFGVSTDLPASGKF